MPLVTEAHIARSLVACAVSSAPVAGDARLLEKFKREELIPLGSRIRTREFLHEVLYRFEAHYGGQIHRFYDQQRDIRIHPPVAPRPNEDEPF